MSSSKRQATAKVSAAKAVTPLPHDWMSPVDAAAPCGADLEYDPEFVVLSAQMAVKVDAQYGDFVGIPEPVNWSEVERDCRRLMMRSKDMRLAVLFTRCRTRLASAAGLAEGLGLLAAWLAAFPSALHPQPGVDDDQEAALEIRMNALQALTDSDGLLSDLREIALTRSTATRLQMRDVERAFAHPRPSDALAPESVSRQLEDLRIQQPDMLRGFDGALASLESIDTWCKAHLGVYLPDLAALTRLLRRVVGDRSRVTMAPDDGSVEAMPLDDACAAASSNEETRVVHDDISPPTGCAAPVSLGVNVAAAGREGALERIRDARYWFEQHEPSSPIPVLLKRAERFVGKRYVDVVKAIPTELLEQWDNEE
ncbi:type VI secretion system protein ImpA [Paraburkholderia sp. BL6669N2]|uniref:type VI secretion system protein TssA n=1 Tax=Paraburkholderia sp. BL6669N2 TaxID=1938807 RepID=UPI000E21E7ED|nr:type VI secretion system ImpA family N-terminal domain-containing protein [Paraburkholderia sp. BL6669N2]REG61332.1 type VI secretion system protein ImpA [Paraburkholderia sp. BL6669N2]